jgi:hypothetical protein
VSLHYFAWREAMLLLLHHVSCTSSILSAGYTLAAAAEGKHLCGRALWVSTTLHGVLR